MAKNEGEEENNVGEIRRKRWMGKKIYNKINEKVMK